MKYNFSFGRVAQALHYAPFRWFLLGRVAASATIYMRNVAQGWLIYYLTGSALSLGWVRTAMSLMTLLLSPLGGVVADRVERRTILIWGRVILVFSSFIIAWLIFTDRAEVWHIALAAMVDGAVFSFVMPAQETIYPELVDNETLLNAVSLDSVVSGLMGIIGAAAAGLLIEAVGAGGVYVGLALLFIFAGYTHFRLPKIGKRTQEKAPGPARAGFKDGIRYLFARPVLVTVVMLGLARVFFAESASTFLPVYAEVDLNLSASGFGLLTSFMTAGGLSVSLVTAWMGNTRRKGRLLLTAVFGLGSVLIGMALVSTLPLSYLFVFLLGGALSLGRVMQNTVLQTHVEQAYRGRINSIARALAGISPLWVLPAGMLADRHGVLLIFGIQGAVMLTVYLGLLLSGSKVKRLS